MKKLSKILIASFTFIILLAIGSCKKFIREELVSTLTEEYYNTDKGIENLINSAYQNVKWKFEYEWSYGLWNFGLDEFRAGDQFAVLHFNTYNSTLNSSDPDVNIMWTRMYQGIHRCNLGIQKLSEFNDPTSLIFGTTASKNNRIAELKGLRAFYYFLLVQQFGGVPLVTVPSTVDQTEFPRATAAQVYNQIISDLKDAGPVLGWRNTTERGRFTKAAAYHFLAKAYLTRASAVTEARGQKPTDLDSAIVYADSVIRFSGHALESNFGNLFNAAYAKHTVPRAGTDGTAPSASLADVAANNNSNEIIFAAQFSSNPALTESLSGPRNSNNQVHLYYISQYDAGILGMSRNSFDGRPFRRLRPTDYCIDIFDWKNDSRFFKTFQTAYHRNVISNSGLPVFTAANAPAPDVIGRPRVGIGDTAALYIVNKPADAILTSVISGYRYYSTFARYQKTSPAATPTTAWTAGKYLSMLKFLDGVRMTNDIQESRGIRNGTLARLAETYLILAEAYGRKSDYANALTNINIIRTRAAYKSGEPKNPHHWMFYGGAYNDLTATASAMLATTDLFTTNAASEMYPSGVTSTADRFIHFMLNERTRELCGELYRWEDLARTETFYIRARQFNPDAGGAQPFHRLRPIPLPQIISQTKNGKPLTSGDITAYQNPGY
ncbi:MAG: RagB/SusD family nutrient uptake outer membrane protein [Chitinophagaceae bacterium]|nr:RagB/SusD family nutrient uptake outer membrane protein [Chitinophagaceae bacterium]